MSTKTAQIVIEVEDKSLQELNDEIKTLEQEIGKLTIGTKEWNQQNQKLGQLKTKFSEATREAQKMQAVVEKVGGAEQLKSIAKLGTGLVGTFASVNGAITLLGSNSEVFEEITAKAASFLQVMGGLNAIAETFSKETLKGLASVGDGFKNLVTTVKGASTGIKAALVSTGIGALVVSVGLLIANFDKIKTMFSGAEKEQKKLIDDNLKSAEFSTKLARQEYETNLKRNEANRASLDYKNSEVEKAAEEQRLAVLYNDLILKQIDEEFYKRNKLENEIKTAKADKIEELNNQIQISKEVSRTLEEELKLSNEKLKQAMQYFIVAGIIDEINNKLKNNADRLIILNAQADKQRAIYLNQLDSLDLQIKAIKSLETSKRQLTKSEIDQLDTLYAQRQALNLQEKERQRILKLELQQLKYERSIQNEMAKTAEKYGFIRDSLQQEFDLIQANTKSYEDQVKIQENFAARMTDYLKRKQELVNFDEKGKQLFQEQTAELEEQYRLNEEIFNAAANTIAKNLEGKNINADKLIAAAQELALYKLVNDAQISKLENDKLGLKNRREDLDVQKEQVIAESEAINLQLEYYNELLNQAKLKLNQAQNDEERKTAMQEILTLESQINDLNSQALDKKTQMTGVNNEIQAVDNEILTTNQKIDAISQSTVDKSKELTAQVENQSRGYVALQDAVKKYQQEIQVSTQLLGQSFTLISTMYDEKAKAIQREIDDLNEQYDELEEKETDAHDLRLEYEEELQDANGERYDELLGLIDEQMVKEQEAKAQQDLIDADIKKKDKERQHAAYLAAKWQKANSIIQAIIAGELAVVKALPNLFLAAATGVLSAASIATIVAQKVPPESSFDKGGYTGDGGRLEPAGIVHKGEYVIPAHVVNKPSNYSILENLESQRLKGYADGGMVTPALGAAGQDVINYDRLISGIVDGVSKLPNPQVSVLKITDAQREVSITKQNASLTR